MKKYLMLFALSCVCFGVSVQAQTFKFGHINVEEVINLMPERDSAWVTYQKVVAELEETYVGIQTELQQKYAEWQQKQTTWTTVIRETKEKEISDMQQRLELFRQNAQQNMEESQGILFAPVYSKANEAIKRVGKNLGLIYVFNAPGLPYFDEDQSVDLLPLVKQDLKIPAEKVAPTPIGEQNQR